MELVPQMKQQFRPEEYSNNWFVSSPSLTDPNYFQAGLSFFFKTKHSGVLFGCGSREKISCSFIKGRARCDEEIQ
jgi:hypothetical protein